MAGQKQIWWKKLIATALLAALFAVIGLFIHTPQAHAAVTYNWGDIQTINEVTLSNTAPYTQTDSNSYILDSSNGKQYNSQRAPVSPCTSPDRIVIDGSNKETGQIVRFTPGTNGNKQCQESEPVVITLGSVQNQTITVDWIDATTIREIGKYTFASKDNGVTFQAVGQADCTDTIQNVSADKKRAEKTVYDSSDGDGSCKATTGPIDLGNVQNQKLASGSGGGNTTEPTTDPEGAATLDPNVQCFVPENPLTWFICPIIKGINAIVNQVDNLISNLLTVDQTSIFESKNADPKKAATSTGYYKAWQSFRGFALAFLLLGGLVMVIAQALGFEILDAYTIKKILPRLIFAVIGIALSWDLMHFFIIMTNDIGLSVRHIIYFPFKDIEGAGQLGGGSQLGLALISSGAILALGIVGLFSFVLTALLSLFVAFIVLVVRQLVIVMLVLFAPIAIACSILPNTQSVYKLWYESFTKAMMMFPIIMGFLALGRVFSVTFIGADVGGAPAVSQLIGFASYYLPYFLIPATFKFAGGALRTIGGSINDKNRGAFDRLKKFRGNKVATNMHAMKEGTRYRDNNMLARGFNKATHNTALASQAGVNPYNWKSRFSSAKQEHNLTAMEDIRKSGAFIAGSQDDRVLRAAQHGKGLGGIEQHLREKEGVTDEAQLKTMTGLAERMQNSGPREAVEAAIVMQRFATGTGFTYKRKRKDAAGKEYEEEYFDYADAMGSIRDASGGDRQLAGTLLGQAKGIASGAGQTSFGGASYGTLSGELDNAFKVGGKVDGEKIALNAFDSTDAATASKARGVHLENMVKADAKRIAMINNNTAQDVQPGELGRRTAQLQSWNQTIGMYGAADRQTIANNETATIAPIMESVAQAANDSRIKIERPPERVTIVSPDGTPMGQPASSSAPAPQLVVTRNWNPGMPVPNTSDPAFRAPSPGPRAPKATPPRTPDDIAFDRNQGGRPSMNDSRTREQLQPPDDAK